LAFDPQSGKSSAATTELFDISRKGWKLVGIDDEKANAVLDGDPATEWRQDKDKKMPIDLVIDLGKEETLTGFSYLPGQNIWNPGFIATYEFYISNDNADWKLISKGEFANIKNNPLRQVKKCEKVNGRYIKLRAVSNTQANDATGYAEIDILTN
jgi:alpha-L-fucosidase